MSDDPFGKWWPCLRKHYKRKKIWLPRAKELAARLNHQRPFRYFTLCARPMIDVYMMVRERILAVDETNRRIQGVCFCELSPLVYPEMIELIGIEESGFLGKLEDLTLFSDTADTETLDTIPALENYIDAEGEGLAGDKRDAIERKRKHLQFRNRFPFDFLNLDFCDRYYGKPPDVMKINSTIDKLLEWQRQPGTGNGGQQFSVSSFVLAITCRVDNILSPSTSSRLVNVLVANAEEHAAYRTALQGRGKGDLAEWSTEAPLDFFMSGWPKEIARMARNKQWDIKVHDHVFYDRVSDEGELYYMVCLVVEFMQTDLCQTYLAAAEWSLDPNTRTEIKKLNPDERDGQALLSDLWEIVKLRNKQAERTKREILPEPHEEILRLRAEGVPI